MVKVKKKKYEERKETKQDVIIKYDKLKLYFENSYALISLINDFVIGLLFLAGSLSNILGGPEFFGNLMFLIGSLALIVRPSIRIAQSVHIYNEKSRLEEES